MTEKHKVTILYDAVEDKEKARATANREAFPLVYEEVAQTLTKRGHEVKTLPAETDIKSLVGKLAGDESDVVFNLCESLAGDGRQEQRVAAMLELLGKRFTGSGSIGMALATDKGLAKKLFRFHDIRYPQFSTLDAGRVDWADDLAFPLIVKPLAEDASIGIDQASVVHGVKELLERISHVHELTGASALVEEYIEGREIYVGVLGNGAAQAFPILEWDLSAVKEGPKIASAEAKWDRKSPAFNAPELFPEDIPEGVYKNIQATAVTAFQALELRDYARVDMRLRQNPKAPKGKEWEWFLIEINPNPYLQRKAEFVLAARKHGLNFPDLLEAILNLALERSTGPAR